MPPFPPGHPRINTDRVVRYGPKGRAWYRLYEHQGKSGRSYISGAYGIWGRLDPQKIESDWSGLTDAERQAMRQQQAAAEAREREKREFRAAAAAKRAAYQWRVAQAGAHEYLTRKGITVEGVRVDRDGTLLIPMYSLAGAKPKLVGLQKIFADGKKRFSSGMAKEGACTALGKPTDGDPIFVAEGYATARSIRMAIEERFAVVVAFDAGNLAPVAKALRSRYRRSRIVFCADDDAWTEGNPGRTKAREAQLAVGDSAVVWPVWGGERAEKATDFNDLHAAEGLAVVAQAVLAGASVAAAEGISTPNPASAEEWDEFRRKRLFWGRGGLEPCRENVMQILEQHPLWRGVLGFDEFANAIVKRKLPPIRGAALGEWTDNDDLELGLWLRQQDELQILMRSVDQIAAGVYAAASRGRFHPVREYLEKVAPMWDGTERLDSWLDDFLGSAPSRYASMVGRFFFIGMVARIYQPGCMMRSVLILEGEQNRGKSTALRVIGGDWYSDTPFVIGDKDSYQSLRGKLLYEISELDSFSRAEATRVKAFVSSTKDTYRASYDRRAKDWPRQCVFAATTNQHEYLKDPTGATRFHPISTEAINLDGLADVRDQLFAEAVQRFKRGERWHPTSDEEREHFRPEQEMREIEDPWRSAIVEHVEHKITGNTISVSALLQDALGVEKSKMDNARQMAMRVSSIMRSLGWVKKRKTDDDRSYYYERPQRTPAPAAKERADGVPF